MDELTSALLKGSGVPATVRRNVDNDVQNGPEETQLHDHPRDVDIPDINPPPPPSPRTENEPNQKGAASDTVNPPGDDHSSARQVQEVSNPQNLLTDEIRPEISQTTESQSAAAPAPTHRPRIDEPHEKKIAKITQNIPENIQPEQYTNNQKTRETDTERGEQPASGTLQIRPVQECRGDEPANQSIDPLTEQTQERREITQTDIEIEGGGGDVK